VALGVEHLDGVDRSGETREGGDDVRRLYRVYPPVVQDEHAVDEREQVVVGADVDGRGATRVETRWYRVRNRELEGEIKVVSSVIPARIGTESVEREELRPRLGDRSRAPIDAPGLEQPISVRDALEHDGISRVVPDGSVAVVVPVAEIVDARDLGREPGDREPVVAEFDGGYPRHSHDGDVIVDERRLEIVVHRAHREDSPGLARRLSRAARQPGDARLGRISVLLFPLAAIGTFDAQAS
jgi:hypothetical protein